MALSVESVASYIRTERSERANGQRYIADFTARQRLVNEYVVDFAASDLDPGAICIDACAGPEGSMLAATLRQYTWIGNDISGEFTRHLKQTGAENVVMSDFAQSPFLSDSTDAVFFIFALHSVVQHDDAIRQAYRIAKVGGKAIIADPGPSMWITRIITQALIDETGIGSQFQAKRQDNTSIASFFANKPYTLQEYASYYLYYSLGMSLDSLYGVFEDITAQSKKFKHVQFAMQNLISESYYKHIISIGQSAGFDVEKIGLLPIGQGVDQFDWHVDMPFEINVSDWGDHFYALRSGAAYMLPFISDKVFHAQKRITVPIISLVK